MRPLTSILIPSLRHVLPVCAVLTLLGVPGTLSARQVERTLEATAEATVEIENTSGSVRVRGWDKLEVYVEASVGDDVEELSIEGGRNHIQIEVEIPDRGGWRNRDLDSRLEIWVPHGARLDIETVSASIEVDDFRGRIEAESVSGNVEVAGTPARVDLESVSGSIRVEGVKSHAVVETVSGSIRLDGVANRVEASTVSGSIDVEAGVLERGDFETVSGTVEVVCGVGRGARIDASSHSGNVVLEIPSDVSASFEATTFSGRIENDFGQEPRRESKWVPSKSLEFSTGGGSAEITLETFSGSVRIRHR